MGVALLCSLYQWPHEQGRNMWQNQLFADNTKLQKSTPQNDVQSLTRDLQPCTDDIQAWMCNNQLEHNEDKTEANSLLNTFSVLLCLHTIVSHGRYTEDCVFKVRNLGFILDSNLTMKNT